MNRKDISISNAQLAAYCKREQKFQQQVYPGKIQGGKMSKDEANRYWCIIQELGEMAQLLEERGIDWKKLKEVVVLGMPVTKPKVEQQRLF
jgi:hypothetical protein